MRRNVASLFKRASCILILFLGIWLLQSSSEDSLVLGSTTRYGGTRRNAGGNNTRRGTRRTRRATTQRTSGRGRAAAGAAAVATGTAAAAAASQHAKVEKKDTGVDKLIGEVYGEQDIVKAKSVDPPVSLHDTEVDKLAKEFDDRVNSVCSAAQRRLVVSPDIKITLEELRSEANRVSDDSYFSYSTFLRYTCGANSVFLILFGLIGFGLWLYSFVPLLVNKYKKPSEASDQEKGEKASESATTKDVVPGSTAIQINGNAKHLATSAKRTQYAFFVMRISAIFLITVTAILIILACSVGYTGIQSGESALCTGMETARGLFFGGHANHSVPSDQPTTVTSLFDYKVSDALPADATSGLLKLNQNISELRAAAESTLVLLDPAGRKDICGDAECTIAPPSTTVVGEIRKYLMEARSYVEKLHTIVSSLAPMEPKVRQTFVVTETIPGLQTIQADITKYLDLLSIQSVTASSFSNKSAAIYETKNRSAAGEPSTETVTAELADFVSSLGSAAQGLKYRGDSFYVLLPLMGTIIFICLLIAMGFLILNWSEFAEVPLDDTAELDCGSFVSADEVGGTAPKVKRMHHMKMLFLVWLVLMPLSVMMFFITAGQASFNNGLRHFCDKAANVVVENSPVTPYDSPAEMLIKSCFQKGNGGASSSMVAQKMGLSTKLNGMKNTCDILENRVNSMLPTSSLKALKQYTDDIIDRIRKTIWIVLPEIASGDRIPLMEPITKSGIQLEDGIGEVVAGQPQVIAGFKQMQGRLGPWTFNMPKNAAKGAVRSVESQPASINAFSDPFYQQCFEIFSHEEIFDTDSNGERAPFVGLVITADWPKAGDALTTRWMYAYEQASVEYYLSKGMDEPQAVKKASDCKLVMLQSVRQVSRKLRVYGSTVPITLNDKPRIYNVGDVLTPKFSEPYLSGLSAAMEKLVETDSLMRSWTSGISRRRLYIEGDVNCTNIVASYTRNIYSGCQIALPKMQSAEAFMGFISYFLSLIAFIFILFGIWWRQSMVRKESCQPSDTPKPKFYNLLEKFKLFHVGLGASA